MRAMITGARALISIDWAQRIKQHNCKSFVVLADSFYFPLGRFSKNIDKYVKTSSPRFSPENYIKELLYYIDKYQINILIPTCEEAFYISKYMYLFPKNCYCLLDDFDKLTKLHNKFTFLDLIEESNCIKKPETLCIKDAQELADWISRNNIQEYIIKPVYSRFGSEFVENIDQFKRDYRYPLVVQQKIKGKEFCSYTIANAGTVVAHSCYHPKYKAGVGAGIYFEVVENLAILEFCKNIIQKINYTGQIGFDFIYTADGMIYPIECNPRGTSGLHLIPRDMNIINHMLDNSKNIDINPKHLTQKKPLQIMFAMALFFYKNIKNNTISYIKDFFSTLDVYSSLKENRLHLLQIISFIEVVLRSIKYRFNLKKASTIDIEWDGHEIE
jgi:glutathione synthase/RimK-type ligase-like ATP-grasp enzyme